jgi:deoxyhypusine synthase
MTEKNKWSNVSKGYKNKNKNKNTKINQLKIKDEENKNIYNILDSSDTYLEIENKVETIYTDYDIYTDYEKGKIILNSYPILSDLSTK